MADASVKTFYTEGPQYANRMMVFSLASSGEIQEETVTAVDGATAAQGDFILVFNKAGDSEALWLDIDAAGIVPTAPEYLSALIKTMVSITSADTDAEVALAVATAATIADVTFTDNTDGTITVTQDKYGVVAPIEHYNSTGLAAGTFTTAVDNAGVDPVLGAGLYLGTVEQTAVGTYKISWERNYARDPEGAVTSKTDNRVPRITAVDTYSITVEMQDLSGGAAADGNFSLVVLGSEAKDPIRG